MFGYSFINFVVIITLSSAIANRAPKVTLSHGGVLVGSHMKTLYGKIIHGYRGIPYAKPPVGKLRFAAPIPASNWTGEKLANKDAEVCPQQDPFEGIRTIFGNEDCLYLNVYTKKRSNQKLVPVMFYIHGGGWVTGGGISVLYGPDFLLEENIVLVTFNYRLGPLGFLSTATKYSPGNNGLKDQVLALKWVQKNIRAFGGNPKDVTIFGQSAGGASVTYHMISPLSKGLFHKAIIQSGDNFEPWALTERSIATTNAKRLAKHLNCPTNEENWKKTISCLRTKSSYAIINIAESFYDFEIYPLIPFSVVVEPNIKGAFLTKQPSEIPVPHSLSIPIIIGTTSDEGLLISGALLNLYRDKFTARFNEVLPIMLYYNNKPEYIKQKITDKIFKFYLQRRHDYTKENHQNLTNLFTDRFFYANMVNHYLKTRFPKSTNVSVGATYMYLYDHRGPRTFTEVFQGGPGYYGVCHSDELFALFNIFNNASTPTGNDAIMKRALPAMWANFARTGNPTPPGSHIKEWKRAKGYPLEYAHLGSKFSKDWKLLENKKGHPEERLKFWKDLEHLL